tara:strand:- start:110 stop:337 length:228 start_codon:yes stop_codon:yes gene_type:complete
MKTAFKPDLKSKTFSISKSYTYPFEKKVSVVSSKFYQKSLALLIAFSTFLIFPESPKELGNICESYNTTKICNVW